MVDVSKKGNVEKRGGIAKKGRSCKMAILKNELMPLLVDNHSVAEQLWSFCFSTSDHISQRSQLVRSHPGYLCFVILITWRTQDASWWPRWGWQARRRWCRHWCQRPSEGSHSATSAPGLASHISLQRRIGFSIWLGDDNKYKVQVHRPDNR